MKNYFQQLNLFWIHFTLLDSTKMSFSDVQSNEKSDLSSENNRD